MNPRCRREAAIQTSALLLRRSSRHRSPSKVLLMIVVGHCQAGEVSLIWSTAPITHGGLHENACSMRSIAWPPYTFTFFTSSYSGLSLPYPWFLCMTYSRHILIRHHSSASHTYHAGVLSSYTIFHDSYRPPLPLPPSSLISPRSASSPCIIGYHFTHLHYCATFTLILHYQL